MSKRIEGNLTVTRQRFGLVASRFNEFISSRLVAGATDALVRHGCRQDDIIEVWVPGAWELPLATKKLAEGGRVDAVVALGCVIRGQTAHFDYLAAAVSKGLSEVSLESGIPVSFGVLTVDTLEQAIERAGSKMGNKGADAAMAAIEMVNLLGRMSRRKKN